MQWMGAVRMKIQTADKNITIIRKWKAVCIKKQIHNFHNY